MSLIDSQSPRLVLFNLPKLAIPNPRNEPNYYIMLAYMALATMYTYTKYTDVDPYQVQTVSYDDRVYV